jgi:hypothetical protein
MDRFQQSHQVHDSRHPGATANGADARILALHDLHAVDVASCARRVPNRFPDDLADAMIGGDDPALRQSSQLLPVHPEDRVDLPWEHVQVEIVEDRFAPDGQPDVDKVQHGVHRPSALREMGSLSAVTRLQPFLACRAIRSFINVEKTASSGKRMAPSGHSFPQVLHSTTQL